LNYPSQAITLHEASAFFDVLLDQSIMKVRTAVGFALILFCFATPVVRAEERSLREVVDGQINAVLQREKIQPAELTSDHEFLRRVFLDLVGTIPGHDEAIAFFNDAAANKREQLIDRLLDDPRFSQHQADVWDLVFFGRNPPGYETDRRAGFQNWLKDQFAKNTPYDQWARQILRAEGNTVDDGPPMFFVQYRNQPEDASEAISQIFLGVQLQCARCHDHPYEPWKQLDFYGMAAFLSRLDVVNVGKKDELNMYAIGEKSSGDILFTGPASRQTPGKKGDPVKPKFLLGEALVEPPLPEGFKEIKFEDKKPPPKPLFSRKDQLADWMTDATKNPYFARAVANRVWAQFMGRGIVHPVDNMSPSNTPSHPELLDELTKQLVEHHFDLKWYIREICLSRTYQLSSRVASGEPMPRFFEHGRTRPLSAEELADAWRVATNFQMPAESSGKKSPNRFHPLESGYMLRFFGQPNSGTGDFQGGLQEHLYLNNGPIGNVVQAGKGSLLESLGETSVPIEQRVRRLFVSILSRPPADDEQQKFVEFISADKQPQDRWRQTIWVLLTCSEFRFNH
jgi:Protein of unknown function (DUF1549)/Protein of unknown function (DUF1553)